MKIEIQDLTKSQLNWAVGACEGHPKAVDTSGLDGPIVVCGFKQKMLHSNREGQEWVAYQPSTDWAQGGPVIERERITLDYDFDGQGLSLWTARKYAFDGTLLWAEFGDTPLIAAMRCFVKSRLGDEIEIPEELMK